MRSTQGAGDRNKPFAHECISSSWHLCTASKQLPASGEAGDGGPLRLGAEAAQEGTPAQPLLCTTMPICTVDPLAALPLLLTLPPSTAMLFHSKSYEKATPVSVVHAPNCLGKPPTVRVLDAQPEAPTCTSTLDDASMVEDPAQQVVRDTAAARRNQSWHVRKASIAWRCLVCLRDNTPHLVMSCHPLDQSQSLPVRLNTIVHLKD